MSVCSSMGMCSSLGMCSRAEGGSRPRERQQHAAPWGGGWAHRVNSSELGRLCMAPQAAVHPLMPTMPNHAKLQPLACSWHTVLATVTAQLKPRSMQ